MRKGLWLLTGLVIFLAGCSRIGSQSADNIVIAPTPRELTSPEELTEDLASQKIYWQNSFIHLDGTPVDYDPITQLDSEESILWIYMFSNSGRFLAYRYDDLIFDDNSSFPGFPETNSRIGLWDLETDERKVLVEAEKDFSKGASLGGIVFTPDEKKVLFAVLWRDGQEQQHVDLATVDIENGIIERLGMDPLIVYSFNLNISPDGKWVVLADTSTLTDQACLLVNLEQRALECLTFEKGWYQTVRITPSNRNIVYAHNKEIKSPTGIYRSNIDGTEITLLVSGFIRAGIHVALKDEIVFSGATFYNPKCSNIYVINLDGSDLRRLSYMGEKCLKDE